MGSSVTEDLGFGITRIDAGYLKPGVVCFYLLEADGACAIVETGTQYSMASLEELLVRRDIAPEQVRYVIPTHVHLDHAGGAGLMMSRFPNAMLLAHPRGARHLADPSRLVEASRMVYGEDAFAKLYGDILPVAAERILEVDDGDCIEFGGRRLLLRHTPGHADHHFCVWDEASCGWFSGDVFGISYAWFRTPGGDFTMPANTPSQFRPDQLQTSIELLGAQNPDRIYLTHYGELSYSHEKQQALLEQIGDYQQIARDKSGDVKAIEEAIMDYSLQRVEAINSGVDMTSLREHIRHDAHLNAQGLAVWLGREQA